jgi:hypothetical protein
MSEARRQPAIVWALVCALGVGAATPATVFGQGIALAWSDCRAPEGAGLPQISSFGCGSNVITFSLYPTLQLASPASGVFTVELVIDVDVAQDPLPPWWVMDGTCRPLAWTANATLSASCADMWNGKGIASIQGWHPGQPGGSTRHARLLVAASVLSQDAVALAADVPYVLCQVSLDSRSTSACPTGCTTPACLVFNSVLVHTLTGDLPVFSTPEGGGSNIVAWQTDSGTADCLSVPARRVTWGAVKSLYR